MGLYEPKSQSQPSALYPVPNDALDYIQQWLGQNPPPSPLDTFANLLHIGSGTPEGVITASPPAIYLNTAGGASTTIYVKESGTETNTGWIGK